MIQAVYIWPLKVRSFSLYKRRQLSKLRPQSSEYRPTPSWNMSYQSA